MELVDKPSEPSLLEKVARDTAETETATALQQQKLRPESQEDRARRRVDECAARIREVLVEYACSIVPYIRDTEPVGRHGEAILLRAGYAIVPGS